VRSSLASVVCAGAFLLLRRPGDCQVDGEENKPGWLQNHKHSKQASKVIGGAACSVQCMELAGCRITNTVRKQASKIIGGVACSVQCMELAGCGMTNLQKKKAEHRRQIVRL
jgi:hypothetical protein